MYQGSFMRLSGALMPTVHSISTGIQELDDSLGVGGLPKGRIIEIYGLESAGKSSLCSHIINTLQNQGGVAALIDAEFAFHLDHADKFAIDLNELILMHPEHGDQALEAVCELAESGLVDLIVIDSAAALVSKKEIEGSMDDKVVSQAHAISKALERLSTTIRVNNCTVIFINQLRPSGLNTGKRYMTAVGNAINYYSSIRLEIIKGGTLKRRGQNAGFKAKVKIIKNKVAISTMNKETVFKILFKNI